MTQRAPDKHKSPQCAPCMHFQCNQLSPGLQYPSSSVRSTEQTGEGHSGLHAVLEMEDSVHACTSKSGFFSLSCYSLHNLLSASCAHLLVCLVLAHTRSGTAERSPSCQQAEKVTALDLINSIQVSHLGCELSPSRCQSCLASTSHLSSSSSSSQLLPKLEAGKCSLLGWLRELPTVVQRVCLGNEGDCRKEVGARGCLRAGVRWVRSGQPQ